MFAPNFFAILFKILYKSYDYIYFEILLSYNSLRAVSELERMRVLYRCSCSEVVIVDNVVEREALISCACVGVR